MKVFQCGYFNEDFKKESIDLFRQMIKKYETDDVYFAICGSSQDVRSVMSSELSSQRGVAVSVDEFTNVGAISILPYGRKGKLGYLICTCEENKKKSLYELFKAIENNGNPLRKRLPRGVVV
jgi:hypothetical protein